MADSKSVILERLGELVVKWNACENLLRELVVCATGDVNRSYILIAHMGTTALCDALRTLANEYAPPEVKQHVPHLITFFEIIREYRNYYVHGISAFLAREGEAQAQLAYTNMHAAKSRLTVYAEPVSADDIASVIAYADEWTKYINPILVPLLWPEGAPPEVIVQPISSLEKPPLPKKLQKRPLFPLDAPPPPPPS